MRYNNGAKISREVTAMKRTIKKYKLTRYEICVAIDALNAKRLDQKSKGENSCAVSELLLRLIDALEA